MTCSNRASRTIQRCALYVTQSKVYIMLQGHGYITQIVSVTEKLQICRADCPSLWQCVMCCQVVLMSARCVFYGL